MNTLWNKLLEHNVVSGEEPLLKGTFIPWYVRFMQGFAGWLAALFLMGFFAAGFSFMFKPANGGLVVTVGILCSVAAYLIIRLQKGDFLEQLGMAFSLCGQLMVALGLFFLLKIQHETMFYILAAYQLFLAWIIPQYAHRLLSTCFGLLALLIALNISGFHGIGSALIAVVFSFIWVKELQWGKKYSFWEPIGFGVAITMVFSSGFLLTGKFLLGRTVHLTNSWLFENAELISSLLIALVFVNLVLVLLKENKINFKTKTATLSLIAAALLIVLSFKIYGISSGLLILIIGFARQRMTLIVLGIVAVISFFSWYYYNLQASLLFKSIVLIIFGIAMLVAWLVINYIYGNKATNKLSRLMPHTFAKRKWLVIATILLALSAINININKKQDLIANGEILLFKLAPVDPKSLMQGDYMRLRFDIAVQTQESLRKLNEHNTIAVNQGHILVTRGENNVVELDGIYDGQKLSKNQYKLPFKYRKYQIVFTTNAFYFQEGKAEHFQKAKYGQFRVSNTGEMLLVNMVDEAFNIL